MIKFNQTISMLECVHVASDHIKRCIANKSSGVRDIKNQSQMKNRIVEYAAMIFINRNYHSELLIECEDLAQHYLKPIGTVIKKSVGIGQLKASEYACILKDAKRLTDLKIQREVGQYDSN